VYNPALIASTIQLRSRNHATSSPKAFISRINERTLHLLINADEIQQNPTYGVCASNPVKTGKTSHRQISRGSIAAAPDFWTAG
jgi:hypothetical protein